MKRKLVPVLTLMLLVASIMPLYAAHYSGGFSSGQLTYVAGSGSSSRVQTAASQWNNISSNVSLTYSTATNQYGGYTASIICHESAPYTGDPYLHGQLYPYKSWTGLSGSLASTSDTWVKAIAYQYSTPEQNLSDEKIHTLAHEIGHALSIKHKPESIVGLALVYPGVRSWYDTKDYDEDSLKAKWGN